MATTTKMGHDNCPTCGYVCDSSTNLEEEHPVPVPEDISVCINCGGILKYASDMALEICSVDHFLKFSPQSRISVLGARKLIKERGPIL